MKRRTFSKALISPIGFSAMGGKLFPANIARMNAGGNKWSAKGLKLGISHQRPDALHEKHFNYLKQMGVEYLEIRIPSERSALRDIIDIRDKVENAGLKVFEIMLADKYNIKESALGLPGRDEEITNFFKIFSGIWGKRGIDTTTYAWLNLGAYQTGTTLTRGCRTRLFELESAQRLPNLYDQKFHEAELWDHYEYFMKACPAGCGRCRSQTAVASQRPSGCSPGRAQNIQQHEGIPESDGDIEP